MAALVISREGKKVFVFELRGREVTIGRKGEVGPDRLVLDDPTISTNHARLERHGNQYMVQDMNSVNGVILNGNTLLPGRLYPIQAGDRIQICDFVLELGAGEAAAPAPAPAPPASKEGLPSALGAFEFHKIYSPRDVVGGDFFVSMALDSNRIALGLGDATGGGSPEAGVTLQCNEQARALASRNASPIEGVTAFQQALGAIAPGLIVTFLYGILDVSEARFRYANGGHVFPIAYNSSEPTRVRKLVSRGEALVGGGSTPALEEKQVTFQPGDALLLMTNGVLNASPGLTRDKELTWKNHVREGMTESWGLDLQPFLQAMHAKIDEAEKSVQPFGFEGVARTLASHGGAGIRKAMPAVVDAMREYVGGSAPLDDVTLLGMERVK